MISRREFVAEVVALTGAAVLAPRSSWAADRFPSMLDHIILGCSSLDHGIALLEERTGMRAAFGGVHPDRGTMNALLSLGERHYLEIMAPDPKAKTLQSWAVARLNSLKELTTPRLVTWAVHTGDIDGVAKKLRESGIAFAGPLPGSRVRPDGRVLNWKTLNLTEDRHGVLPFFIEWGADSAHPSSDAPAGCHIEYFAAADQDPGELSKSLQRIGVDVLVEHGDRPQLRMRIAGPKGSLEVSS
jgi:hypothetical protein